MDWGHLWLTWDYVKCCVCVSESTCFSFGESMVHAAFRFSKGLITLNMKNHCGVIPVSELQCNRCCFLFLLIYSVALNPHQWCAELFGGWEGQGCRAWVFPRGKTTPPNCLWCEEACGWGGVEMSSGCWTELMGTPVRGRSNISSLPPSSYIS